MLKTTLFLVVLAWVPACGGQGVESIDGDNDPLSADSKSPTNAAAKSPTNAKGPTSADAKSALNADPLPLAPGACAQKPVKLDSAGNFAALAGSTITNTGPTSITGDMGVSAGSSITGFLPGKVDGAKHASDSAAAEGIADLTVAYNDAAGRTLCPIAVAGNLGGQTLAPGLYKSTSSLAISSGDLTLDAQGDSNAVFIFQMASTLVTTSGRRVILAGGARAKNIFWQVGSSATFGSTSVFIGTVMADQAITMKTGATLQGRALARIAATNFDSNAVVLPSP